jgi:hypothetical protein
MNSLGFFRIFLYILIFTLNNSSVDLLNTNIYICSGNWGLPVLAHICPQGLLQPTAYEQPQQAAAAAAQCRQSQQQNGRRHHWRANSNIIHGGHSAAKEGKWH